MAEPNLLCLYIFSVYFPGSHFCLDKQSDYISVLAVILLTDFPVQTLRNCQDLSNQGLIQNVLVVVVLR